MLTTTYSIIDYNAHAGRIWQPSPSWVDIDSVSDVLLDHSDCMPERTPRRKGAISRIVEAIRNR